MLIKLLITCVFVTATIGSHADSDKTDKCILPPYPAHGTYASNATNAKPGDAFDILVLNVTCAPGYGVNGANSAVFCFNGTWSEPIPKCVAQCKLSPHASVEYRCLVTGPLEGSRACKEYEPTGTVVSPRCKAPNYYSESPLPAMRCINGSWDYLAICKSECGTLTPQGDDLLAGASSAKRGEVPWHAGIYTKTTKPYRQICAGSLVSNNVVLSVAHCFWNDLNMQQSTDNYAVAVGKLYRPWDNDKDDAQKSDVKEIHLPVRYHGAEANFQDDIAIVIVKDPFEYKPYVRPVCVDFDITFERRQLVAGNMGKVAGWGLTGANEDPSPILKVLDVPYVDLATCITSSSPGFRDYITSDKFCAGYNNGEAGICKGDTGGGLAFPESERGRQRYYLRGIVSIGETSDTLCNLNSYTGFTQVSKHEHFIKQFLI